MKVMGMQHFFSNGFNLPNDHLTDCANLLTEGQRKIL